MKKIISIILSVLLIISFVGCGNTTDNSESETISVSDDDYISEDDNNYEEEDYDDEEDEDYDGEDAQDEEDTNVIPFDWTDVEYKVKDSDGYKFKIKTKLSPWILTTNTDTLDSAWEEVDENENSLPEFNDWSLEKNGNVYKRDGLDSTYGNMSNQFNSRMTDMYYCVGSVSFENITKGWDITESSERSVRYSLQYFIKNDEIDRLQTANIIGRIFYSTEAEDYYGGIYIRPKMTDNDWGPCSFILMAPENLSPKHPNGDSYKYLKSKENYFSCGYPLLDELSCKINNKKTDSKLRIGVIGKNGKYIKP